MELFRIIKRALLLIRDEVKQSLKDSKGYTDTKVAAEAKRADVYADTQLTTVKQYTDTNIAEVNKNIDYLNTNKLTVFGNFHPFSDVCKTESFEFDGDPDFVIWEIFRHIYTSGFVGKGGVKGCLYYTQAGEEVEFEQFAFFNSNLLPSKVEGRGNCSPLAIYNIDIPEGLTSLEDYFNLNNAFFNSGDVLLKYISSNSINSDTEVTSCYGMFNGCSRTVFIDFDYPKNATDYRYAFRTCNRLRHKSNNVSLPNATDTSYMFQDNHYFGIEYTPVHLYGHFLNYVPVIINLPQVIAAQYMFSKCKNIKSISTIYVPTLINANGMYNYCDSLQDVESIDMSVVTQGSRMFEQCSSLVSINSIIHSSEINLNANYMFRNASALKNAPSINGVLTDVSGMFSGCTSLVSAPRYTVKSSDTSNSYVFEYCSSLEEFGGFEGNSHTVHFQYCHLLTRDSCLNIFNYAAEVTTSPTITLHSEAYARLSEEDIAIAVNKGWTVASA